MDIFRKTYKQLSEDKEKHNFSQEAVDDGFLRMVNFMMYYEKAYRYRDREKSIQEMMNEARLKDERIENAEAPLVNCLKCKLELIPKYVDIEINDNVLFIYDCPNGCLPRRAFYDDGTEHIIKDKKCPECDSGINEEVDRTNGKFLLIEKCSNCDYKKVWDYSTKKEREDPDFERDKKEFCFDEKEGQESIQNIADMERFSCLMKDIEEKDKKKDLHDAVKNLPRLSIHELKKRLDTLLEENEYSDLIFAQPQISTDIQVSFTAYETKSDRKDYDSRQNLKNLLKKDLLNTNWRLMSGGIEYRMGVLSGRLRGYDNEKDLLKLEEQKIKNAKKKK